MAENDVTIRVGSIDNTSADFDALKARFAEMSAKVATATVDVKDKGAVAELDKIKAQLAAVGARTVRPSITVQRAAQAEATLSAIDVSLDKLGDKTVKPKVDSSDIEASGGMMGLLVTGALALGPAFIVAGAGAAIFGGAAIPAIEKAAAGTGPLESGLKELKGDYAALAASVQPEVIADFTDAVDQAKGVLPEFSGVAQAGGKAVGELITDLGEFAQSPGVKAFLAFVAQQAGPDMQAGVKAVEGLASGALGLVEALNPLGKAILPVVGDLGQFVADVSKASPLLVQTVTVVALAALSYNKLAAATAAVKESSAGAAIANWVSSLKGAAAAADDATVADKGLAVAEGEVEALNPVAWAVGAAVAVTALALATRNVTSANQDAVGQINKVSDATGTNIAGYEKASKSLGDVAASSRDVTAAQAGAEVGFARAGQAMGAASDRATVFSAAAKDDADKAQQLANQMHDTASQLDLAAGPATAIAADMTTIASSTSTATQKTQAFTGEIQLLTGAANSLWQSQLTLQQGFLGIEADAKTAGASMTGTNAASVTLQQAFAQQVQGLDQYASAQQKAGTVTQATTAYLAAETDKLAGLTGGNVQAIGQVEGLIKQEELWGASSTQVNKAIDTLAGSIKGSFISSLASMGKDTESVTADTDKLTSSILKTGTTSASTAGDRAQLIKDLENAGVSAQKATSLVNAYIKQLAGIPSSKTTDIIVHGDGTFTVGTTGLKGEAAGGLMTGGIGGKDSILSLLMPGEVVVPTGMVQAGEVDHLRGRIPRFGAGGVAGSYHGSGSGEGAWVAGEEAAATTALEQAVAVETAAAIKAAQAAAAASAAGTAGAGGGAPASNQALAKSLMPAWSTGQEWASWLALWNRESGWNQYAKNPTSGAYGIPQALPASKMGAAANPPQSNPHAQITWGIGYIQTRPGYGNPINAEAHEQAYGWYGSGGATSAGWSVVGERGRELLHLPGGASVLPNGAAEQALGGGVSGSVAVQLQVLGGPQGSFGLEAALLEWLRETVRTLGGGNVQQALGRN